MDPISGFAKNSDAPGLRSGLCH